ncbi:MAG: phosphate-starvation-inducible PsiE family protein [Candidatus Marinimicrobia bacterium]|nr:phosphate-starvation-inducible PsiE family protein [Candidatus Neomarinimicrobiota bacterium]
MNDNDPKSISYLERAESLIYFGAGALITVTAFIMLGRSLFELIVNLPDHPMRYIVLQLLDDLLLVLMLVELIHTIIVSMKTHVIKIVPFLAVGLIAAIRRILIITVEASHLSELSDVVFQRTMIEISVLSVGVLIFVFSIFLVRKSVRSN